MFSCTRRGLRRLASTTLSVFLVSFGLSFVANADEDGRKFLEELRREGRYAEALEHLDKIANDPNTSKELAAIVDFERGITLLAAGRAERADSKRDEYFRKAAHFFGRFVEMQKADSRVPAARSQIAAVHIEQARKALEIAHDDSLSEPARKVIEKEARDFYAQAAEILRSNRDDLKQRLAKFAKFLDSKNPDHKDLIHQRDQYRRDYLSVHLQLPAVQEELADTYREGEPERRQALRMAAGAYEEAHELYRRRLAGLYARMYAGRCYLKLREFRQAIHCLEQVLATAEGPDDVFRSLRVRALTVAVECWLHDTVKQYERVVKELDSAIGELSDQEAKEQDWLALRLSLARAYLGKAAEVKDQSERDADQQRQITDWTNNAKGHLSFVCQQVSDVQKTAQTLFREQFNEMPPVAPKPD